MWEEGKQYDFGVIPSSSKASRQVLGPLLSMLQIPKDIPVLGEPLHCFNQRIHVFTERHLSLVERLQHPIASRRMAEPAWYYNAINKKRTKWLGKGDNIPIAEELRKVLAHILRGRGFRSSNITQNDRLHCSTKILFLGYLQWQYGTKWIDFFLNIKREVLKLTSTPLFYDKWINKD